MDMDEMPLPTAIKYGNLRQHHPNGDNQRQFHQPSTNPLSLVYNSVNSDSSRTHGLDLASSRPIIGGSREGFSRLDPQQDSGAAMEPLVPCPVCLRTFSQTAISRHAAVCQKVQSKPKRAVFKVSVGSNDGGSEAGSINNTPILSRRGAKGGSLRGRKQSPSKSHSPALSPDGLQKCPHCERKFGFKSYEDHVRWCEEKAKRLQDAPTKDPEKIAKLNMRVSYKPKAPLIRTASEQPPNSPRPLSQHNRLTRTYSLRKPSNERFSSKSGPIASGASGIDAPRVPPQSLAQAPGSSGGSLRRTKSFGRASGISYLRSTEHTRETPETHFIRNATGRGSIKKPAPTKAFLLRMQSKQSGHGSCSDGREEPIYATSHHQQQHQPFLYNNQQFNNRPPPNNDFRSSYQQQPPPVPHQGIHPTQNPTRGRSELLQPSKTPAMAAHQKYFSQLRDKWNTNVRKLMSTGGGGSKKADKATVMTPAASTLALTSIQQGNDSTGGDEVSYCPFTTAAEQLRQLLDSPSNKSPAVDVPPRRTTEDEEDGSSVLSTSAPPRLRLTDFEVSTKDGDGGEESSRDSSLDYQDDLKSIVQVYFESNNLETSYCRHCSAMFPLPNVRFCCDCGAPRDLVKPVTKKLATRTAMEENSLFSGGHHQSHHAMDEFCDQRETTR